MRSPEQRQEGQESTARPPADAEYMGSEHKTFFRELLLKERREIMARIERSVEELRGQEVVSEEVDQAQIHEQRFIELRLRDRDRRLLKKIDAALLRLQRDEYGWCEETGEPIGLERLMARPATTLSVEGKQIREQMGNAYER